MSYAVIQTGGKQYKVSAGEILKVEKLADSNPETKVEFKEILAYGDDKSIELGEPTVSGAKVEAELLKNGNCDLVIGSKYNKDSVVKNRKLSRIFISKFSEQNELEEIFIQDRSDPSSIVEFFSKEPLLLYF